MEGFCQECDRVDDSDHPFEKLDESSHALEDSPPKPEGKDASLLVNEGNKDIINGGDDSLEESDDVNSPRPWKENDDGAFPTDGGDSPGEENDEGYDSPWEENDNSYFPKEDIDDDDDDDGDDFPWEENDNGDFYDDFFLSEDDDNDVHDYFYDQPRSYASFERVYYCFPLSFVGKTHIEVGNKIIMPAEALMPLLETQISMPMQFEIQNQSTGKVSHCGVLEFTGEEEGAVFLPDWMMKNMQLQEGDLLLMKNKNLEKGTYIKLQPHTTDFLGISNPKAVLEENLQKFSCLTMGDTIMISHESKNFYINVVETKPSAAISIIDADCEVDFAPPLDYKEPAKRAAARSSLGTERDEATQKPKFKPFTGLARRLGEKPYSPELDSASLPNEQSSATGLRKSEAAQAKPISNRSPRGLVFQPHRSQSQNKGKELASEMEAETLKSKPKFQPFTGKKYTLAG